jgi:ATP-dependent DNA helicase RecG
MDSNFNDNILDADITSGVGAQKAALLRSELEIKTYGDLLYFFPFRYVDRNVFHKIGNLKPDGESVQLYGKIVSARIEGLSHQFLIVKFADSTGRIELKFKHGIAWRVNKYRPGCLFVVYGKPEIDDYNHQLVMWHPEVDEREPEGKNDFRTGMFGVYHSTENLKKRFITNKVMVRLMIALLNRTLPKIQETLPDYVIRNNSLLSLPVALLNIHFPQTPELLEQARYRLKFDELFDNQLGVLWRRNRRRHIEHGFVFGTEGERFNSFNANNLPFPLTGAQIKVMEEIRNAMRSGRQMNSLLQGDVGSGKTLVALMSMLIAADNGFQSCLMAPTEILANQHLDSINAFLAGMNVRAELLTGSTKTRQRREILSALADGKIDILIGTHALIEDSVGFCNLGLVVVDEQHRFGVAQRAKLWIKAKSPPHILVMTATPIPRTLEMTEYGDLDVLKLDELPPGRKPVKTVLFNDSNRLVLFGFMRKQIAQGRQIYVVYPLIKESEKFDYKYLEDGYESIVRAFPPPEYVTVVVHGKMKAADKDYSMNLFVSGRAHIMVATTVIEVGVNVPNATVMVIESAQRFGLSQLHQLRGRVGRGADQSYCVLMADSKTGAVARERLKLMTETNDGFKIAEADLKMRGPGDIEGTAQSGLPVKFKIADLSNGLDSILLADIRQKVEKILDADPQLALPENAVLKNRIDKLIANKDFSKIS